MSKIQLSCKFEADKLVACNQFQDIVETILNDLDVDYESQSVENSDSKCVNVAYSFDRGSYDGGSHKKIHPIHVSIHNALFDVGFENGILAKYLMSEREIDQLDRKPLRDGDGNAHNLLILNPAKKL